MLSRMSLLYHLLTEFTTFTQVTFVPNVEVGGKDLLVEDLLLDFDATVLTTGST